jgi:hypothetical protein
MPAGPTPEEQAKAEAEAEAEVEAEVEAIPTLVQTQYRAPRISSVEWFPLPHHNFIVYNVSDGYHVNQESSYVPP